MSLDESKRTMILLLCKCKDPELLHRLGRALQKWGRREGGRGGGGWEGLGEA